MSHGVLCKAALCLWEFWTGYQETHAHESYLSPALLDDLEKVTFLLWASGSSLPNGVGHP